MMSDILSQFDSYSRKARIYPGLIAASPIAILVVLLWKTSLFGALGSLVVSVGGLFLLSNVVRTLGRAKERHLIRDWGAMPTTLVLRHSGSSNQVLRARRHEQLSRVTGLALPSEEEERIDPSTADQSYEAATRILIAKVREDRKSYPRLAEENANYGFRRNLLALKVIGLLLLAIALVVDVVYLLAVGTSGPFVVAVGCHVVIGVVWLAVINAGWVYDAGDAYAQRLFDTLEKLPAEGAS